MPLGEDLPEHGHLFFRAILLIPGDQHDVLPLARTGLSRIRGPLVLGEHRRHEREANERQRGGPQEAVGHGWVPRKGFAGRRSFYRMPLTFVATPAPR